MKKLLLTFFLLLFFVFPVSANTIWNGNLTNLNGIEATGPWNTISGFSITWNVSQTGNIFHYEYEISGSNGLLLSKDISHIIFQVSDNFKMSDIFNIIGGQLSNDSPKTFTPGPSNPNMPGSVYGLKFDPSNPTNTKITFNSTRMPIWGDFYAKDGKDGGLDVTAWNKGFGNIEGVKIGVPDTQVVPIPTTGFLLVSGLITMVFVGKRKINV